MYNVHLAICTTIRFILRKRLHEFDVTEEQLREADVRYLLNFGSIILSIYLLRLIVFRLFPPFSAAI